MSTLSLDEVITTQAGWYRGDFHLHSTCSDGIYSPPDLAQLAKNHGLDFFAITDHNSIESFSLYGDKPQILIIPGIEVTLTEGHWNIFGMQGWLDWMEDVCVGKICTTLEDRDRSISEIMLQSSARGLLNSINHPLLEPWEWQDLQTPLQFVDCVEIWNDPLWSDNDVANPETVEMWSAWLNDGYRITAIGGSDFHFLPGEVEGYPGEYPGLPLTYVFARELSANAILRALTERRVYVTMGPQLDFKATINATDFAIGSDLGRVNGEIQFTASVWGDPQVSKVQLLKNGAILAERDTKNDREEHFFDVLVDPDEPAWFRLDVIGKGDRHVALTNPIFVGPCQEPKYARYQDFLDLLD